jgi:hypothetical protein
MNEQEYRADPRLNASKLKQFHPDLSAFKALNMHYDTSDAMEFGTAVHDYLEHKCKKFSDRIFHLEPGQTFRSKANKLLREASREDGCIVLSHDRMEAAKKLALFIWNHPPIKKIIRSKKAEREIIVTNETEKALIDLRHNDLIIDWKTCATLKPNIIWNSYYDIQAYHYMKVAKAARFMFVFVETTEPYEVACLELDADSIAVAARRWQEAYDRYMFYQENEYTPQIIKVSPPRYLKKENEEWLGC